jgi:hypothetical protein
MTSDRFKKIEIWQKFQNITGENKRKEAIAKNRANRLYFLFIFIFYIVL